MLDQLKIISKNKKAFFNYFIEDEVEAGIVLNGSEVKSIRDGRFSIVDSYIVIIKNEVFIINMDIPEFKNSFKDGKNNYNSRRNRKLLLHKNQINKLIGKLHKSSMTMICTMIYWKKNKIKLKIALARGKKNFDKRREIKKKDEERDARQEIS